jgi:UDP-glucose 4-epimerase
MADNEPIDRVAPRKRRVLLTGGAGFIGGHLTAALLDRGDHVTVIDDLSTGRTENLDRVRGNPDLRVVIGDVRDASIMGELTAEADLVYHLAAVVGVQLVVDDALTTIRTNVLGTDAVLGAAAEHGVPVMLASTSEVYGKCATLPAREDDDVLLGASRHSRWSYAASKLVDEMLALAYHRQAGLPVVVFRLFNTVGPRQTGRYGMVVPRLVEAALAGQRLPVHGDGLQSRSFLHVADAVSALVGLADCPEAVGCVVNVGASREVTIGDLARRVLELTGGDPGRVRHVPYNEAYSPGYEDVRRRVADTSRLEGLIGWRVTRSLDDIINDVIADVSAVPERMAAVG